MFSILNKINTSRARTSGEKFKSQFLELYKLTNHNIPSWKIISLEKFDNWYIKLQERYKHEEDKLLKIAEDFKDYYEINVKLIGEHSEHKIEQLNSRLFEIERRFANGLQIDFDKLKNEEKQVIDKWSNDRISSIFKSTQ